MIEGIKIDIESEELKTHLLDKVKFHQDKTVHYETQVSALEKDKADLAGGSNNPVSSLQESAKKHKAVGEFFQFMADHIVPNETYRLQADDLRRLEIVSYYF